jgi:pimeloyl-ACP methyl ester carboxylesterase
MHTVSRLLSVAGGIGFLALGGLALAAGRWGAAAVALAVALILMAPARVPSWLRALAAPVGLGLVLGAALLAMGNERSIYATPEVEARLMALYDAQMRRWPVPIELRDLETEYGTVRVVVSGPDDGPPLFLLPPSSMASWSWRFNVAGLAARHRVYAVDTIGDVGRSVLADAGRFPPNGAALARLYAGLMDRLGVDRAAFAGGSQGAFIATSLALHHPERVTRLVLCGPMGLGGTNASVLRILLTTLFPVRWLEEPTLRWAFGDDPALRGEIDGWFRLVLEGVVPRQPRPRPFTSSELASLRPPVLLVLGRRDGLVGDPARSAEAARAIPDVRVEVLDAGHLVAAERPAEFNALVLAFLAEDRRPEAPPRVTAPTERAGRRRAPRSPATSRRR